jgi:predicted transcriptional regulator
MDLGAAALRTRDLTEIRRTAAACVRRHLRLAGRRGQNWTVKTFKTRHQFYLPDDLSEKLEALAGEPGSSKTAILTDAFRVWLERRGATELDDRFAVRLDRLCRTDEQLARKLDFVAEALGTFVQHQLTLFAHQPPFEAETAQLGLQRYRKFIDFVAQRLVRPDQSPTAAAIAGKEPTSD